MNKPLKKSGKNGKPQIPFLIKYSLNFMLAVETEQVVLPETDSTGFRAAPAAKSLQSCLTLCDPTDGSPPGSSARGIFQARIPVVVQSLSRVQLFVTPRTAAHKAPRPSLSPGVCLDSCALSQCSYLITSSSALWVAVSSVRAQHLKVYRP